MFFVNGKTDGEGRTFDVKTMDMVNRREDGYKLSGNNPADKVQNIYDLESNYCEWTAEAYGTGARINRGSIYSHNHSASNRGWNPPTIRINDSSSRATLYLAQ